MKTVDIKSSIYTDIGVESNDKDLKLVVDDHATI